MKKVKVTWREYELVSYGYIEEFEVAEDFEITKENCLNLVKNWRETDTRSFDTNWTDYQEIDQELYPVKVDDVEEVLPPSPEEKKAEYLELLNEMELKIAGMLLEKERILKLVNE